MNFLSVLHGYLINLSSQMPKKVTRIHKPSFDNKTFPALITFRTLQRFCITSSNNNSVNLLSLSPFLKTLTIQKLRWYIWGNRLYIDFWVIPLFFLSVDLMETSLYKSTTAWNVVHPTGNILMISWYHSQRLNHSSKIDDKILMVSTVSLCGIFISLSVNNIHQLDFACLSATSIFICNA